MAKELAERVAALEKELGITASERHPKTLIAEIEDVEKRIEAMGYMDEDVITDDVIVDDGFSDEPFDVLDEPVEDFMDDGFSDEPFDVLDEPVEDFMDMDTGMTEDYCGGPMMASESKPGVEDEIDQDYLSEVVDLVRGGDSAVTNKSMLDAARAGSEEHVALLRSASARLDRVADHLQKTGRKKMALKIDMISNSIDARIEGGRS